MSTTNIFYIKAYTVGEMRRFYEVGYKTWRNWMKPFLSKIGERKSVYYTAKQVWIITKCIGLPGNYEEDKVYERRMEKFK
jgi:hypothetical protein